MNIRMALFLLIASIVLTVPALAQSPVNVRKIAIELTGVECADVSQVFVIANGVDGAQLKAERDKPDGCRWTYESPKEPYVLGRTRFSLRLRGARTPCRYAVEAEDREDKRKRIGYLVFAYEPNDADDLTITTVPPKFDLTYSRKLSADKRNKQNVECDEGDIGEKPGMAKLKDVSLLDETLDLEIAWTDRPAGAKWVTLDRYRKRIKADAKKRRTTELKPDDLGAAEVEKISRRNGDIAPNQGEKVGEVLRTKGLESVQVKVE